MLRFNIRQIIHTKAFIWGIYYQVIFLQSKRVYTSKNKNIKKSKFY